MKTLIKTIAISAVVASFAAPSFAAVQDDVIRAAGTNGHINVQVNGDVVTLHGFVEDSYARVRAERVAKSQGYEVQNNLFLTTK